MIKSKPTFANLYPKKLLITLGRTKIIEASVDITCNKVFRPTVTNRYHISISPEGYWTTSDRSISIDNNASIELLVHSFMHYNSIVVDL